MDTSKSLSLSVVETILSEQLDEAKNEIIRLKSLINSQSKEGKETILCAAIWYKDDKTYKHQPTNIKTGYVFCGRRHHNVISLRNELVDMPTHRETSVQGFITSLNRFVDRIEGNKIAIDASQVFGNIEGDELISEDLY